MAAAAAAAVDSRPVSLISEHDSGDGSFYSAGSTQSVGQESVRSTKSSKSTKSLSVFLNPNASLTMPRSEEMTYNLYDQVNYDPNPSSNTSTVKKSKSKSKGSSKKHSKTETAAENKKAKSTTIKQGSFQIIGLAKPPESQPIQSETSPVKQTDISVEKIITEEITLSSSTKAFRNTTTSSGNGKTATKVTDNIIKETVVPTSAIVDEKIQPAHGLVTAAPENVARVQKTHYISEVSVSKPKVTELLAGGDEPQGSTSAPATLTRNASRSSKSNESEDSNRDTTVLKQRLDDESVFSGVKVIPEGTVNRITRELSRDPSLDDALISSPSVTSLASMERKNKEYVSHSSADEATVDRAAKMKSQERTDAATEIKRDVKSTAAMELNQSGGVLREISDVSTQGDQTDGAIPKQNSEDAQKDIKMVAKEQIVSEVYKTKTPPRKTIDVVEETVISVSTKTLTPPAEKVNTSLEIPEKSPRDHTPPAEKESQLNSLNSSASTSFNSEGYTRDLSDDHDDSIHDSRQPAIEREPTKCSQQQPLTVEVIGPFTTSSSDNTPLELRQAYDGTPWARRAPPAPDSDSTLTGDSDQYEGRQIKITPREKIRRDRSLEDAEVRGDPVRVSRGINYEPKKRSESSSRVEYERSSSYQGRGQRGTPREKMHRDEHDLEYEEEVRINTTRFNPMRSTVEGHKSPVHAKAESSRSPPYQGRGQIVSPREKIQRVEYRADYEEEEAEEEESPRVVATRVMPNSATDGYDLSIENRFDYSRSSPYLESRVMPREKIPQDDSGAESEEIQRESSKRVITARITAKPVEDYDSPEEDFEPEQRQRDLDPRPRSSSWEYMSTDPPIRSRVTKKERVPPPISVRVYTSDPDPPSPRGYITEEQPRRNRVVKEKKVVQRRYVTEKDARPIRDVSEKKKSVDVEPISIRIIPYKSESPAPRRFEWTDEPRSNGSTIERERKHAGGHLTTRVYESASPSPDDFQRMEEPRSNGSTLERERKHIGGQLTTRIYKHSSPSPDFQRMEEPRSNGSTIERERKHIGGQLTTRVHKRTSPSPDNFQRLEEPRRNGLEKGRISSSDPISARIYMHSRDDRESPRMQHRVSLTKTREERALTSDSDVPEHMTKIRSTHHRHVSRVYPDAQSEDVSIYSDAASPPRRSRSVAVPTPTLRPIAVNISHSLREAPPAVAGVISVKSCSQTVSDYASYPEDRTTPVAGIISVLSSRSTPVAYPVSSASMEPSRLVGIISITEPESPHSYRTTPHAIPSGFIDVQQRNRSPYRNETAPYRNGGFDSVSPYPQNIVGNGHHFDLISPYAPTNSGYEYDGDMAVHGLTQMMTSEPEVAGVDPELKDAQKAGNMYHIAMNLRPALFTRPETQFSRPETQLSRPESRGLSCSPHHHLANSMLRPQSAVSPYPDNSIFMEDEGRFVRSVSVVNTPVDMDYGNAYLTPTSHLSALSNTVRSNSRMNTDVEFDLNLLGLDLSPATPDYDDDVVPVETTYNDRYVIKHIDQTVDDKPSVESRYILGSVTETPTARKKKKLPNIVQSNHQISNSRTDKRPAGEVYEFVEEVVESHTERQVNRQVNGYEVRSLPKERPYIKDKEYLDTVGNIESERDRMRTKMPREGSSKGSKVSSKKYIDVVEETKPGKSSPPSAAPRSRSSKAPSAKPDYTDVVDYSKTHITVSEASKPSSSRSRSAKAPSYGHDSNRNSKTAKVVSETFSESKPIRRQSQDSLSERELSLPRHRDEMAANSTLSSRPRSPLIADQNNNYDDKLITKSVSDVAREPSIVSDSTITSERSVNSIIRVNRGGGGHVSDTNDGYEARPVSDDVSHESINVSYRGSNRDPGTVDNDYDNTDLMSVDDVMIQSRLTGGFSDNAGDYGSGLDRKMDQRGERVTEYMRKTTQHSPGGGGSARGSKLSVSAPFADDEFDQEIRVNRDFNMYARKRDDFDDERPASRSMTSSKRQTDQSQSITSLTKLDVRSLYMGAPAHSVKQTIKVDRLEDEILTSLPRGQHPGFISARYSSPPVGDGTTSPLDGYDNVDEQVEMDVTRGKALLTARVLSEKIVPILGTEEMFKKSSVIVTRKIEVDLTVTPQRKSLYDLIVRRQRGGSSGDYALDSRGRRNSDSTQGLTQAEHAELYRAFMALAELEKAAPF